MRLSCLRWNSPVVMGFPRCLMDVWIPVDVIPDDLWLQSHAMVLMAC